MQVTTGRRVGSAFLPPVSPLSGGFTGGYSDSATSWQFKVRTVCALKGHYLSNRGCNPRISKEDIHLSPEGVEYHFMGKIVHLAGKNVLIINMDTHYSMFFTLLFCGREFIISRTDTNLMTGILHPARTDLIYFHFDLNE